MSIDKEFEQLSAYIDNELTPTEREYLQQRIASSPQLQAKLADLQRMKNLVTSIDPLPEDNSFQQRLNNTLEDQKSGSKFIAARKPAIAFAAVTIVLMVFIKFSPIQWNSLFEEQKSSFVSFYTQNLQPFFTASDLSSDDIFTFAFHKTLPVDKEANQVLSFTSGDIGKAFFEIRDKQPFQSEAEQKMDMEQFISSLDLDRKQQNDLDSILRSYSDRISSTILVNDNSTLAVNPDLINIQAALRAEILSFAADANEKALDYMIGREDQLVSLSQNENLAQFISNTKENRNSEYYCFTPDTSFIMEIDINMDSLHRDLQELEREVISQKEKLVVLKNLPEKMNRRVNRSAFFDSVISQQMEVWVDQNSFRFEMPMPKTMAKVQYDCDSIRNEIDHAMTVFKSYQFRVSVSSDSNSKSIQFSYGDTSLGENNMNIDVMQPNLGISGINVDSLVQNETLENFQFDMGINDSTGGFYFKIGDSVVISIDSTELHFELENFRHEIKDLRREMQEFKENLPQRYRNNGAKDTSKKRWEI